MLKSTGFFRGLDCPFYSEGKDGRNGCNRPYCHFRHCLQRRLSYGDDIKKAYAAQKEGYDPFNPEVVRSQEKQNGQPETSDDLSGALEQVNKAIEEVQNQVEMDKRKLSHVEKELYDPSEKTASSFGFAKAQSAAGTTHSAYDPGSYQMTSGGYNPAPGCSKYTLDSDNQGSSSDSMEYVPTSLKKPSSRTQPYVTPPAKYSSNCKYTLDNCRPSTDMEYDPLSNFSAGIKDKKVEKTVNRNRTHKAPRFSDEEYVPAVKKPRHGSIETSNTYTISDSDGENSSSEYRPTSLSTLKKRKSNDSSVDAAGKERNERTKETLKASSLSNIVDLTLDSDSTEEIKRKKKNDKRKQDSYSSPNKSSTPEKIKKVEKKIDKTLTSKLSSNKKVKESLKGSPDSKKKDKIGQKEEKKVVKLSDKEKGKYSDALKNNSKKQNRDLEEKERKKLKTHDKEQGSKDKEKAGKLDVSKKDKRESKSGSERHISKVKGSSSNGTKASSKHINHTPSHLDLFGDDSAEEAEPLEVDDESEEELVRMSANALKRQRSLKKRALEQPTVEDGCNGASADDDVFNSDEIDYSIFQDLDFESDPLEECLRIFNESKEVKTEDKGRQGKQQVKDTDEKREAEETASQKKRVSHFVGKGSSDATNKAVVRPQRIPTAQEVCYQRMQMAQQQAAQMAASVKASVKSSSSSSSSGDKRRIAHRPNPQPAPSRSSPVNGKPAASRVLSPSRQQQAVKTYTAAGILSKTESTTPQRRMAHTPTLKSASMKRPVIPVDFGAKVPTNVRQRYLSTFIDECVKFCPSEDEAFQMGLDEEKMVYDRSSSKNIYLNLAVNALKKLRSKSTSSSSPRYSECAAKRRVQSHEGVLGGRLAATTSFTINRMGKKQEEKLTGVSLYYKIKTYLMTEEQLQEHGYPRVNPAAAGKAVLFSNGEKKIPNDPFSKICRRCGAKYRIDHKGNCVRVEECSFHWGRQRRQRVSGGWETSYSCCSGAVGSTGCQVSKQHVQDGRVDCLDGYVTTFSKPLPPDGNPGVFALDCEMCYTKQGLELTRVTVIDSSLKVIYDTFVKPQSPVVDYNTRFSGVTEEDLESVTITLRDVQAVLLSMFAAESILVGHSLESDLLALKVIHSSVVDTSIVFPHRLGLPYKRALRNLMADHLKRIIQDSVEGHDSSEDACACMELMMWKLKEDAKVKR